MRGEQLEYHDPRNDGPLRRVLGVVRDAPPAPSEPGRLETAIRLVAIGLALLMLQGCALRTQPLHGGDRARSPQAGGFVSTLEAGDPVLSAALLDLDLKPGPVQHRRVAERYYALKIFDAAYDHFLSARNLDATDAAAYEGVARVWRAWGFPDRGLPEAVRSVHYAPTWPMAHNTLGTILLALGRPGDARRAFERALALQPGAAYLLNNLCYLSLLQRDLVDAEAQCRAALAADPGFSVARNNLALVYAAAQHDDWAEREFLAAGDAAAASYNIGLVYLAEGRYAAATRAFDAASRQRPSWTAARAHAARARDLAARLRRGDR